MKRISVVVVLLALCAPMFGQGSLKTTGTTKNAKSGVADVNATRNPAQPINKEYTDSILANTTDKQFLTDIVDHLPASDRVPSPEKILGYPIGTPKKLTYTKDQHRYY